MHNFVNLILGDPSYDGHGKTTEYLILCDDDFKSKIGQALILDREGVASDYEDSSLSMSQWNRIKEEISLDSLNNIFRNMEKYYYEAKNNEQIECLYPYEMYSSDGRYLPGLEGISEKIKNGEDLNVDFVNIFDTFFAEHGHHDNINLIEDWFVLFTILYCQELSGSRSWMLKKCYNIPIGGYGFFYG